MCTRRTLVRAVLVMAVVAATFGLADVAAATHRPHDDGRITFGRFDPELGDFSIWVANPDGTHQQRLTLVPSFFSDWSPNGRRVAFDFVDDVGVHVATIRPDGTGERQLTFGPGIQETPKWSPDGRWITFGASPLMPWEPGFFTSIWIMRADGSRSRQVTTGGFDVEPVFSPDGTRIAFGRITSVTPDGMWEEAIYVVNSDGTDLREVVAPRSGLEHPDWSPDGRWITFNIGPESPQAPGSGSIIAVRPDGRGERVLRAATERFVFFKPVWSPNGRQLLVGCFDRTSPVDKLCVIDANGRHLDVVIDATPFPVNFPAWGPAPPTP
jgi:Tol biopolymer transport system component